MSYSVIYNECSGVRGFASERISLLLEFRIKEPRISLVSGYVTYLFSACRETHEHPFASYSFLDPLPNIKNGGKMASEFLFSTLGEHYISLVFIAANMNLCAVCFHYLLRNGMWEGS